MLVPVLPKPWRTTRSALEQCFLKSLEICVIDSETTEWGKIQPWIFGSTWQIFPTGIYVEMRFKLLGIEV